MSTLNKADIDIIIPVYNALDDVKHCITSILTYKGDYSINLIIVNDASKHETTQFLRSIDANEACITLFENDVNKGYAKTANVGMKLSTAPYVILMNSDIIVSQYWLQNLVQCAESDSKIGIVSPVTNAAIWQSIPFIPNNSSSSTNFLPSYKEVNSFADLVKNSSYSIYPRLPYIHGFCQFIKRKVVDAIGFVDEENFPNGLGSEQDYCYRASDAGFFSVIADDTFIYHSKAKSLGKPERKFDWEKNLNAKYGEQRHRLNRPIVNGCFEMKALRMITTFEIYRAQLNSVVNPFNYNICILINSENDLCLMDSFLSLLIATKIDENRITVLVQESYQPLVLKRNSHIPKLKMRLVEFHSKDQLVNHLAYYDIVMCSSVKALVCLENIQSKHASLLVACYVSDKDNLQKNLTACNEQVDHSFLKSVLFLTHSDNIAKAIIRTLGVHAFNLMSLDLKSIDKGSGLPSLFGKAGWILILIKTLTWHRQEKALLLLLKDSILYHRKDKNPVFFSKGSPPYL